jgi:hypothetical protein
LGKSYGWCLVIAIRPSIGTTGTSACAVAGSNACGRWQLVAGWREIFAVTVGH